MNHQVEIEPCRAEARELSEAIGRVGFTPVAVQMPLPFDDEMPDSGTSAASTRYSGVVDVLLPGEVDVDYKQSTY